MQGVLTTGIKGLFSVMTVFLFLTQPLGGACSYPSHPGFPISILVVGKHCLLIGGAPAVGDGGSNQ